MKVVAALRGVLLVVIAIAVASLISSGAMQAQKERAPQKSGSSTMHKGDREAHEAAEGTLAHQIITPAEIKWGPAPPGLPAGAQAAVLSGDPSKSGEPYTLTAKMPANYTIPPHWHPVDENIVVVSGQFLLGEGDRMDTKTTAVGAGGFAAMPKEVHHFAKTKGATTIVVYGNGPFDITYVNPNDDPRKKTHASR